MTCQDIVANNLWKFSGSANKSSPFKFWYMNLMDSNFFTDIFLNYIIKFTNKQFKLIRVYANGQTYGQDGEFHIDSPDDNAYTFVYYISEVNESNIDDIGGYIQIKKDDELICIEPYMNRGILFNSKLQHRGLAPSRLSGMLRVSIAFKLELLN